MKQVSRVFDQLICRDVAMARLRPETDRYLAQVFLNEARLTAQLDHPNIIKIHDMGTDADGTVFFTMDIKTGHPLSEHIIRSANNSDQIAASVELFIKICEAIAYAHAKGIVHLDIKPANIQIGEYGEVIVCDWGLGTTLKPLDFDDIEANPFYSHLIDSKSTGNRVSGTPGFMAPEQYDPSALKDERTDLYGLGALFHTLLTGAPPTDNQKTTHTMPEALESICTKALKPDREQRYASVETLINDLRLYQRGYTTSAEVSGFRIELNRFFRRNRRQCITIGSSALILLFSTALFIIYLTDSMQKEQASRLRAEQSEQRAKQANLLYENEKMAMENISEEYHQSLFAISALQYRQIFYDNPTREMIQDALKRLNKILKKHPENAKALNLKSALLCIIGDFNAVVESLKDYNGERTDDLYQLALHLADNPSMSPPASPKELAEVIRTARIHAPARRNMMLRILTYDYASRQDKTGYQEVIRAIIQFFNPKWDPTQLEYSEQTRHLKLSGHNLTRLNSSQNRSLLSFLDVKSLDISGTDVYSWSHFKDMQKLAELDIRETLLSSPPPVEFFPHLKKLTVSPGQFTKNEIESLSKQITLTIQ